MAISTRVFLFAEEARYEDGKFILPEKSEEEKEEAEDEEQIEEPNVFRRISASIQARIITGLFALLKAVFRAINFLLTLLSKLI
ncbi:hypothetical protein AQV86_04545 [Nanohaloarchaea archaeon SG9]|nr:hypothetical protein AQV86_04545 [Nanohaloarchaea archaeon SG9]